MSKSGLTEYQDELLVILVEECSEAIKEVCKIDRFGINSIGSRAMERNHLTCLTQELGDIMCMIEMLRDSGMGITDEDLNNAKVRKLIKVQKHMTHKKDVK